MFLIIYRINGHEYAETRTAADVAWLTDVVRSNGGSVISISVARGE
jgi:hypothetical protein